MAYDLSSSLRGLVDLTHGGRLYGKFMTDESLLMVLNGDSSDEVVYLAFQSGKSWRHLKRRHTMMFPWIEGRYGITALAWGGLDGEICAFDDAGNELWARDGRIVSSLPTPLMSPSGKHIGVSFEGRLLTVLDAWTGKEIWVGKSYLSPMTFSKDDRFLIAAVEAEMRRVWLDSGMQEDIHLPTSFAKEDMSITLLNSHFFEESGTVVIARGSQVVGLRIVP
ncbi:MAG: hypothetical protein V1784_01700 [bacterium]